MMFAVQRRQGVGAAALTVLWATTAEIHEHDLRSEL